MVFYRYLQRSRIGKWYASLAEAQQYANRTGMGFTDPGGNFVAYRGTILELRDRLPQREWARSKDQ